MLHFIRRAPARRRLGSLAVAAFLAGCSGGSLIPSQGVALSSDSGVTVGLPDAGPSPCKGQKNTKHYSSLGSQPLKSGGGSVCVPAFGGWGGALQYPPIDASSTIALVSSTTAYAGGNFPPPGSQKPIFYVQFNLNGILTFNSPLPNGNGFVSIHVVPKKTYTAELFQYYPGIGWSSVMNACYSVAKKVTVGGGIPRVGSVFVNQSFREPSGIIEVFSGKLSTNKC
jgi:hypothetical protein